MIEEWSQLLYNLMVNDIFGSLLLTSAFLILFMGFFAFKKGISFGAFGISLFGLLMLLAGFGFLPNWIVIILIMIAGAIIGMGILRLRR
jgi:hypothetical protein